MSTMVRYLIIALATGASFALQGPPAISRPRKTSLQAGVMNRGLEQRREGATPQGSYLDVDVVVVKANDNDRSLCIL